MTSRSSTFDQQPWLVELHAVRLVVPGQPPLRDVLYMPFPGGRHRDTDAIGTEHLGWLRDRGLVDSRNARAFEGARFYDLAGRIHHRDDRDTVRIVADFIATLFVLDDLLDAGDTAATKNPLRVRAAIEHIRRAAHAGRPPSRRRDTIDAVAAGLADITRRLDEHGATTEAYLAELDRSLDALVEEARRRTTGYASVDDYAEVRTALSAVYACLELGLAAEGRTLPPALAPLAGAVNLSVCYVNDIFSWAKERATGERSNLIGVLMDRHGLDETVAFRGACRAADRAVQDYVAARGEPRPEHCHEHALLESWLSGTLDWHASGTLRYAAPASAAMARAAATLVGGR